jgi:teichuronic acid biosynthesis glycosyltransferase TuaG
MLTRNTSIEPTSGTAASPSTAPFPDRDNLVSIITPAYRAASTIGETIRSVLGQSYPHWEMLIADDCSPDDTCAVIAEWSERDPRIRLIAMPQNGGPAAARNGAIAAARGRWLAFLDADDLWLPQKLERQLAFHRDAAAKISYTAFRRIPADGAATGHLIHVPASLDYRRLLANTAIATSTVIVDRDLSGPVVMKKTYYDDFACWLDILRPGGIAAGLNEDLMRYRVMAASVSRNKRNSAYQVWLAYRRVEGLGLLSSLRYFTAYAWRGLRKYRRF